MLVRALRPIRALSAAALRFLKTSVIGLVSLSLVITAPVTAANATTNYSVNLDGFSEVSNASYQVPAGNLTVEFWYKSPSTFPPKTDTNAQRAIINLGSSATSGIYLFSDTSHRLTAYWNNVKVGDGNYSYAAKKGQWMHVAMVISAKTITLYVDGTPLASETLASVNALTPGISLGTYFNARNGNGQFDRLKIWTTALTISDLKASALLAAGFGSSTDEELLALYAFDEGTGTTAKNARNSSSVADLTLVGTSSFVGGAVQAQLTMGTPTATATAGTLKSINVSWPAVANSTSYTLRIYNSTGNTLLDTISGLSNTSTSYTVTEASGSFETIANGTSYQISLTANGNDTYLTSPESTKVNVSTLSLYSVTYNANGATGGTAPSSQSKIQGVNLSLASNSGSLVRTGYSFSGWNTNSSGTGTSYAEGANYTANSNVTLFAKWIGNDLTVTWNSNGGSAVANTTVKAGVQLTNPANPSRIGYTFAGWSATNGGAAVAFPYTHNQTANFTMYANWNINSYTLTLNNEGVLTTQTVKYGGKPANPGTTRTGFTLTGWSDAADQTAEYLPDLSNYTMGAANDTIYAVWSSTLAVTTPTSGLSGTVGTSFTPLTIATSGGAGGNNFSVSSGTLPAGLTLNSSTGVISGTPTVAGSQAIQVTVTDSATSAVTTSSFTISIGAATLSTVQGLSVSATAGTLKSIDVSWTGNPNADSYTLKIYSADGATLLDTIALDKALTNYIVTGAVGSFESISDTTQYQISLTAEGTGNYVTSSESAKVSVTTLGSYTITWDANGGTLAGGEAASFIQGVSIPAPSDPGRTGHTFAGWSTTLNDATTKVTFPYTHGQNANLTLYALWIASIYTVTYKAGDNATGSDQTATKNHGVDLTVADGATGGGWFTRADHVLVGWSINSNGSTTDYALGATYSTDAALTLYPVWRSNSIEAIQDTHVQGGSGARIVYGDREILELRNATNPYFSTLTFASYAKFEYDPSFGWSGSALEVYVTRNSARTGNTEWNVSYTTFNVDVFGINQATWDEATLNQSVASNSTEQWGLNTLTRPWSPNGGTYLGTISIPTNGSTKDQKFALSNSALDTFLNGDDDGLVTFFFRRSDFDDRATLMLASSEHPTLPGPTLTVTGTGYEYRVAYDINGGTGTLAQSGTYVKDSATSYAIADTTGITPPPNKGISGWNTQRDGNGTDYAPGDTYSSNASLTLYAKYFDYPKVTFKSNYVGGAADIQQIVPPNTNTALRLNSFGRPGYTFAGWHTTSTGTGGTDYAEGADINLAADEELFAKWTPNTYTVLYDYIGATGNNGTSSASYQVGGSTITLPANPTKDGYTFGGWYDNIDFTGTAVSSPYSPTANTTLYAKWNAINYQLFYASTGGTGSPPTDNTNYNIGQFAVIKANTSVTQSGYTFAGWVLDQNDPGETPKNAGATIQFGAGNITLHPKWVPGTYTITYNANGATAGSLPKPSDSFTTEGANVDLPTARTLAKTGYNFGGWSLTPTGAAVANSFSTTQNVTLYAVWTVKPVTVTYDKGLASGLDPAVTPPGILNSTYGSLVTLGAPSSTSIDVLAPAGVDHEFFGWSDGTTTYQPGQAILLGESDLTLTAQWLKVYQVRYALNGGTLAQGDFVHDTECGSAPDWVCAPGQITANSAPTRAGYDFTGWKDQVGADIPAGGNFTVDADTYLLYAQWQPVSYNFSFNSLGGSVIDSVPKTIGELLTLPSPGTKAGYSFSGWTDGVLVYQAGSQFTVGTSSKGFQAVWTPNVSTITYDWQGGKAKGSALVSDTYTYSPTVAMSLPDGTTYERDGYAFGGWATTPGGDSVSDFKPTADQPLYAIWVDGNYTLTYDAKGGNAGAGFGTVARGSSVNLPTPTRAGFVFNGWFDAPSSGNKVGNGGDSHNPGKSKTLYANWVQRSLWGVDLADLDTANTLTVGAGATGGSFTKNSVGTPKATVVVPDGALPENTVVTARYFKDLQRQASLIPGENNYIFSLLVSWLTGSGDTATVPDTDPNKPITVTLTSDAIKAGQSIYQVIGDQVQLLGKATADGSVEVNLYEDPEIVVAATVPDAPTGVTVVADTAQATVSWTAPASDGGSPITGYTVTSTPGSLTCTTTGATSCVVPNLVQGTSYSFSVVATNSVGDSAAANSSGSVSPLVPTFTLTLNSNGGSAVSSVTFEAGSAISAPASPTRPGHSFFGWSTTLNDPTTKITFPYTTGVEDLTFYALWTEDPYGGGSSGGTPVVVPTPTPTPAPTPDPLPTPDVGEEAPPSQIGFTPTAPATPVSQTGPVGNVAGSSQQVQITADAPRENLVASGLGWQIRVRVEEAIGQVARIQENRALVSPMTGTAVVSATGLRPNTFVEVWAFSDQTYIGTISVGPTGSVESNLVLPKTLLPGEHTLQIGTLNTSGQLITLSIPLTVKGKVTVGTFKGYIAIYTSDIHGQRLSAKVAGKWVVQDPISRYKRFTYSRLVRFTGAGYDIIVDVYINRKFYERSTTRTR